MSDIEMETDSDEEKEIEDINKLNAALNEDEPCCSKSLETTSCMSSDSKYEEYSKIETALSLNKALDEKWQRLEIVLQSRLQACRRKLKEINNSYKKKAKHCDKPEQFKYVLCGRPYFKDKTNFPAPDNDDTILMRKSQMYDFSNVSSVSGWTVNDKNQFLRVLETMSVEMRKKIINSKIAEIKRACKGEVTKDDEKKITALKRDFSRLGSMKLKDLALPIDEEYDWEAIANKLNYRHNALEYRALWKLYLHPTINKNSWTQSEHMSLQKIANEEKSQDWSKIAKRLGSGRSNYQCFVYFRINLSNRITGRKWTQEEETFLRRLIEYYKEGNYIPWGKVAASMENRTKIQIYNKYYRMMEFRKGRFLPEEDSVIMSCYNEFGANFKKMSKFLPGRSLAQCRVRFQLLTKKRISAVWTIEEDRKLIQLMANQDLSSNYSSITKYFPGKDRHHIRSRYMILEKWMKRNPNGDIARAPRRGARRLNRGQSTGDLNTAIVGLNTKIKSDIIDKKSKKIDKDTPEDVIDHAIIVLLLAKPEGLETLRTQENTPGAVSENTDEDVLISEISKNNCNFADLCRVLIILRAKLDKTKFMQSSMYDNFKDLESTQVVSPVSKVKTYSKNNKEGEKRQENSLPDIWGNRSLGSFTYVLPPNYATITGLRKIMEYISSQSIKVEDPVNINFVTKRNIPLKQEIALLMERFNILFLWPLILANGRPDEINLNKEDYVPPVIPTKPANFTKENYKSIILPQLTDKIDDVIDLPEAPTRVNVNLSSEIIFQNSDFARK